jgi:hypothetical protein
VVALLVLLLLLLYFGFACNGVAVATALVPGVLVVDTKALKGHTAGRCAQLGVLAS